MNTFDFRGMKRRPSKWNVVSFWMMAAYIFFLYTSNEFLLPARIHSLAMWAFIGCVVWKVARRADARMPMSAYTKWYLMFFLWAAVSLAWAREWSISALYQMAVSLVLTYCFLSEVNSARRVEACARIFAISGAIGALMLLATGQVFNLEARVGQTENSNANAFSATYMAAAIFASWLAVAKKGKSRLFYLGTLAFCLLVMAMSGGRKTILAVAGAYVFFILFNESGRFTKNVFAILKALAALIVLWIVVMSVPVLYDAIGYRFEALEAMFFGGGELESSVNSDNIRLRMIEIGLSGWLTSPLWGHGVDTFKYFNLERLGYFFYAHNNYVELLYDMGIVGFALYYAFVVKSLKKLYLGHQVNRSFKALGGGLILSLLIFDMGGISYMTYLVQFILAVAAFCAGINDEVEGGLDAPTAFPLKMGDAEPWKERRLW